jgi:hypothetical protein
MVDHGQVFSVALEVGDGLNNDKELEPLAISTERCDERDAKHASVPHRCVRAVRGLVRC